jgi:membrane-bound lytic murein transglycosylase D
MSKIEKICLLRCWILASSIWCFSAVSEAEAGKELLPEFTCIKPNVDFWEKVFREYPTTRGIVHDDRNLEIIYEVIPLVKYNKPGARRINRGRIKAAVNKYKAILNTLADSQVVYGADELRVAALFGPEADSSDFREALENLRFQKGLKDKFRQGLIRSGAYLDTISLKIWPTFPMWSHLLIPRPTVNSELPESGSLSAPPDGCT